MREVNKIVKVATHAFEQLADVSKVSQPAKMAWHNSTIAVFCFTLLTSLLSISWTCKALTALCHWPLKHNYDNKVTTATPAPGTISLRKFLLSFDILTLMTMKWLSLPQC